MSDEIDLMRQRYARRNSTIDPMLYSYLRAANWQSDQERQRCLLTLFADHGIVDTSDLSLIEVGAGTGRNLLEFLRFGFEPENLSGVELLPERVALAKRFLPSGLNFIQGDASSFDLEHRSHHFVFQSLVFSSILDFDYQQSLADRMWSWLRPGGAILWYDFVYNNPRNPDVRGVPLQRIQALFPLGNIDARRVTLAPPLSRRLCSVSPFLYPIFNSVSFLRTHLFCWISKS
jgi:SAM-dependent methyltransferase